MDEMGQPVQINRMFHASLLPDSEDYARSAAWHGHAVWRIEAAAEGKTLRDVVACR